MTNRWWRRRRKKRSSSWFDVFDEFKKLEKMMDELMRQAFESWEGSKSRQFEPHIYGFSMSVGPNGKPVIREFGNIHRRGVGSAGIREVHEEREPLIDIFEEGDYVVVVAEVPGVKKEDIELYAAEDFLRISVSTAERSYYKKLILPAKVNPRSAKASYKNGVLEVRFQKALGEDFRGERISVK